ncbi:MAG: hypothetical protein ACFE0Q_08760 [Anaerolineae bacterium]
MAFLRGIGRVIWRFLVGRFTVVLRVLVGVFMCLLGLWFVLAPITQQFFARSEALQASPFVWLIVPVGILQIAIGWSILRPLWHRPNSD